MSLFRRPLYLDSDVLVPLANYHGIEVMTDVDVSTTDAGSRTGGLSGRLAVPLPGTPEVSGNRGKETRSEVTQSRTVRDHPVSALNRLLDQLESEQDLVIDLAAGVSRRQLVQVEADWAVSPATDAGALLSQLLPLLADDPSLLSNDEPPPAAIEAMTSSDRNGPAVLVGQPLDYDGRVLVLLDSTNLLETRTLDDLEDDERAIFGQVDALVGDGQSFSLERFLLRGLNRAVRRGLNLAEMQRVLAPLLAARGSAEPAELEVHGPAIVLRAIAVY